MKLKRRQLFTSDPPYFRDKGWESISNYSMCYYVLTGIDGLWYGVERLFKLYEKDESLQNQKTTRDNEHLLFVGINEYAEIVEVNAVRCFKTQTEAIDEATKLSIWLINCRRNLVVLSKRRKYPQARRK